MKADLHLHTIYSDGTDTPEEIALRAERAGLGLISMTDHDSLEGLEEKREAAKRHGLLFVSGWEVSSYCALGKVHILGYGCRPNGEYARFLQERKEGALVRASDMLKKANACFKLSLTLEDCERERVKKEAPLHTMHVVRAYARVLNRGKDALSMKLGELYKTYFAKGCPAYSELCRPTPHAALEVIHATGGIACLAHPGRIEGDFTAREQLMDELCAAGLDGIECTYSTHTREQTAYFLSYAERKGLYQTGGSDYHAEGMKREIGLPVFEPDERLLQVLL